MSVPIEVGNMYKIGNSRRAGNWIIVTHIINGKVYARGVENTIADLVIPLWKFPGIIADVYIEGEV